MSLNKQNRSKIIKKQRPIVDYLKRFDWGEKWASLNLKRVIYGDSFKYFLKYLDQNGNGIYFSIPKMETSENLNDKLFEVIERLIFFLYFLQLTLFAAHF